MALISSLKSSGRVSWISEVDNGSFPAMLEVDGHPDLDLCDAAVGIPLHDCQTRWPRSDTLEKFLSQAEGAPRDEHDTTTPSVRARAFL